MDLMSVPAVAIHDLSFTYPGQRVPVFQHLNLDIPAGQRFGLFGPNGAGKTTLMNCMTGLLAAGSGAVQLLDHPVGRQKKKVNALFGLVPQDFSFYQELSPMENFEFFGAWYGLSPKAVKERAVLLLDMLGLNDVSKKPVYKFSGGMKRRVNLAIAVLHQPRILFLDEPTVGVDVQTRHAIIAFLVQQNSAGTTLIYTSHQLKEAEELCNRIALIDAGEIIASGTPESLLQENKAASLETLFINLTGKAYRDADI